MNGFQRTRRVLCVLVSCAIVSCSGSEPSTPPDVGGPVEPPDGGTRDAEHHDDPDGGGTVEPDGGEPDAGEPDAGMCAANEHACGLACVASDSVNTCGDRCEPCAIPPSDGVAACTNGACALSCEASFCPLLATNECAPPNRIEGCGANCEVCTAPPYGTAFCDSGACTHECMYGDALDGSCIVPASWHAITPSNGFKSDFPIAYIDSADKLYCGDDTPPYNRTLDLSLSNAPWTDVTINYFHVFDAYETLIYEPTLDRLYVFGICFGACFGPDHDLYWLDQPGGPSPTATQINTAGDPPPELQSFSAVYDSMNDVAIIFGGLPTNVERGLWILNNVSTGSATWTHYLPAGGPEEGDTLPIAGHSAVYDPMSNRMIVFGGVRGPSEAPPLPPDEAQTNDLWILENANAITGMPSWQQVQVADWPGHYFTGHAAAYDPGTNRMLIYGGQTETFSTSHDVYVIEDANGIGTPRFVRRPIEGTTVPTDRLRGHTYDATHDRLFISTPSFTNGPDWFLLEHAFGP